MLRKRSNESWRPKRDVAWMLRRGASRSGDGAREDEAEHGLVRVADTRVGQAGGVTGSEQSDKLAD